MSLSLLFTIAVSGIAAILILLAATVGLFAIARFVWNRFTKWAARSHLAEEQRLSMKALAAQEEILRQREDAMLNGAAAVAEKMISTICDASYRHLDRREQQHRMELARIIEQSSRLGQPKTHVVATTTRCLPEPTENAAPKRRGALSRLFQRAVATANSR